MSKRRGGKDLGVFHICTHASKNNAKTETSMDGNNITMEVMSAVLEHMSYVGLFILCMMQNNRQPNTGTIHNFKGMDGRIKRHPDKQ